MNETAAPVLRLDHVGRSFRQGEEVLHVLRDICLDLHAGEAVALVGPSGAGKSTLLHLAGLLERADDGRIFIAGQDCTRMSDRRRTALRRDYIGFVYQAHHLLPEFSALENVVIPQRIAGRGKGAAMERARTLLDRLGLSARLHHRPARLSGGEQQRVAIARALANEPRLVLADEPTGNLDPDTAVTVFAELMDLTRERGVAALIATHNLDLATAMDRACHLHEGHLLPGLGVHIPL